MKTMSIHQVHVQYVFLLCLVLDILAKPRPNMTNLVVRCHGQEAKFVHQTDKNTPLLYVHFGEKKKGFMTPNPNVVRVDENNKVVLITNTSYSARLKFEGNTRSGLVNFKLQNIEFKDSRKFVMYMKEDNDKAMYSIVFKLEVKGCSTNPTTIDHDAATGKHSTTENSKIGNNSNHRNNTTDFWPTVGSTRNVPTESKSTADKNSTTENGKTGNNSNHRNNTTAENTGRTALVIAIVLVVVFVILLVLVFVLKYIKKKITGDKNANGAVEAGSGYTVGIFGLCQMRERDRVQRARVSLWTKLKNL